VTVLTVTSANMLNQSGFLASLFQVFSRHKISVDLIATAEVSVSLTVDADAPLDALMEDLSAFATVGIARDRAIVAIVGERLKLTPGVAGRCFSALQGINIEMISMGANEINLSFVVKQEEARISLQRLHAALIDPGNGGGGK
jgi:aspartate kinase